MREFEIGMWSKGVTREDGEVELEEDAATGGETDEAAEAVSAADATDVAAAAAAIAAAIHSSLALSTAFLTRLVPTRTSPVPPHPPPSVNQ